MNESEPVPQPPASDPTPSVEATSAAAPAPVQAPEPSPWGFWATIGLSILVFLGWLAAQVIAIILFDLIWAAATGGKPPNFKAAAESNGLMLSLGTIAGAPCVAGLCILFAGLRRGMKARSYLALRWVEEWTFYSWLLGLLLFIAASDGITVLLGRPIVPDFMLEAYSTAGFPPLLWAALILAAPVAEEFLFRGFMFAGLASSRGVPWLAIFFTAGAWALIHVQYDLYGIVSILAGGVFLGLARWKTGSLWLCVALHGIMNAIATIETICYRHAIWP